MNKKKSYARGHRLFLGLLLTTQYLVFTIVSDFHLPFKYQVYKIYLHKKKYTNLQIVFNIFFSKANGSFLIGILHCHLRNDFFSSNNLL